MLLSGHRGNIKRMNRENVVLALLYADLYGEIAGKSRYMIYIFLAVHDIIKDKSLEFKNTSYYYGPWSADFASTVNDCKERGLIDAYVEGRSSKFRLTDKGREAVRDKILKKHISTYVIDQISLNIRKYDSESVRSIANDIRNKYEVFFNNTSFDYDQRKENRYKVK